MLESLNPTLVHQLLLTEEVRTIERFLSEFDDEYAKLSTSISRAFNNYTAMDRRLQHDERSAWTTAYVFYAVNSVYCAAWFLPRGHLIACGNSMRHYGEAVAMSMLFSDKDIDAFTYFLANDRRFPVHDALRRVNIKRNRRILGIKKAGWDTFMRICSFYDQYSHASPFAASSHFMGEANAIRLGGEFIADSVEVYGKELSLITSGADILTDLIPTLYKRLVDQRTR